MVQGECEKPHFGRLGACIRIRTKNAAKVDGPDSHHDHTLKDVEGKRQLDEVTFRNFVCDFKQIDINNCLHIPRDKIIVRIASF
ncbi:hypothetical protein pipiens_015691 [Culex pipiens pipiens]|uniref:Uncharacterized protein n=1 Tax=Culex pipiens pipiens TaxID=38569 RepID=A0ABD1CPD4_CULPP